MAQNQQTAIRREYNKLKKKIDKLYDKKEKAEEMHENAKKEMEVLQAKCKHPGIGDDEPYLDQGYGWKAWVYTCPDCGFQRKENAW